jgi:hypothetical protein
VAGTWGNGWTIWFLSWRKLLAGSATGDAVVADSVGSEFVPVTAITLGGHPAGRRVASALPVLVVCRAETARAGRRASAQGAVAAATTAR